MEDKIVSDACHAWLQPACLPPLRLDSTALVPLFLQSIYVENYSHSAVEGHARFHFTALLLFRGIQ